GLLEAHDIRRHIGQPRLDPFHAGLERVHVPGGDAHPTTLSVVTRTDRRRRDHMGISGGAGTVEREPDRPVPAPHPEVVTAQRAFLAGAFFAGAFLAGAFFAGAFFAG